MTGEGHAAPVLLAARAAAADAHAQHAGAGRLPVAALPARHRGSSRRRMGTTAAAPAAAAATTPAALRDGPVRAEPGHLGRSCRAPAPVPALHEPRAAQLPGGSAGRRRRRRCRPSSRRGRPAGGGTAFADMRVELRSASRAGSMRRPGWATPPQQQLQQQQEQLLELQHQQGVCMGELQQQQALAREEVADLEHELRDSHAAERDSLVSLPHSCMSISSGRSGCTALSTHPYNAW